MPADATLTDVVAELESEIRSTERTPHSAVKVRLLMRLFNLSLADVAQASMRAISKSQIHRILHGKSATPCERRAIAIGITTCLRERCADSAYLFTGDA